MRIEQNLSILDASSRIPSTRSRNDEATSFAETLQKAFERINEMQLHSSEMARQFAAGETDDLIRVVTAAEEASVALQLAVQVRNKVIEAYQEIMRMQV